MHILFLTDNFPPEGNAPATRTFEHACEWVNKGHKVTVITCVPNFPEGKVFEGYKNKWLSKEKIDDINVWRVKTYITANEGFIKRTIDFISFMLSSLVFGLFTRKVDVVIGTSPQFFTVISAWALAKFKRIPFVFELRDIWPASITAVGAMKGSWVIKVLEKLELFLYHQADLITSVTHSFKLELQNRGVSADKIKVVLNGADLSKYKPLSEKDKAFAEEFQLQGKFVAGYVGTHGLAHALDSIIEAAELLKAEDDIKIMFAGGGADKARLEKLVEGRDLSNVVMLPKQPKENMQKIWSLCDVSLVALKDTPLFSTVIPSKIFESMAMSLPIIISVPEGESTQIIRTQKAGLVIPPENPNSLFEAILNIKKDKNLYRDLADNSRLAASKFNRKTLAIEMLSHIEKLVKC
jgi:colanic acid biosynthesis glycosyl transferase WcaI